MRPLFKPAELAARLKAIGCTLSTVTIGDTQVHVVEYHGRVASFPIADDDEGIQWSVVRSMARTLGLPDDWMGS